MKPATAKRMTPMVLRQLRGPYSQRELADSFGMTAEGYNAWESGDTQPNPENFRKLLDHYVGWMKHYNQDPTPMIDRVLDLLDGAERPHHAGNGARKERRP